MPAAVGGLRGDVWEMGIMASCLPGASLAIKKFKGETWTRYTRIRTTSDFTYIVYRCSKCGEHITTDNLNQHASQVHHTYDWVKVNG